MSDEVAALKAPGEKGVAPMLDDKSFKNYGWQVVFAGMGINLALGVLYTWSVFKKEIPAQWGWAKDTIWPYAVACLVFSLVMVPAGRMQDRLGPRLVASIGGVLVGAGLILTSRMTSLAAYIIGFGVLAGAGIGFGYASTTPAAVKWFPSAKTGLIAGIVVSGFGLASAYIAPLANALIAKFGIQTTMLIFGIGFMVVVVGLAQFLRTPHKVLQFTKGFGRAGELKAAAAAPPSQKKEDFKPSEILRTWQFWLLWFMYACGAGAGLMIIGILAQMAKVQAGVEIGFALVAALAIGNGAGRIIAGILSDKIGRKGTMCICFVFQAILVLLISQATIGSSLANAPALAIISALIGANYGANLTLFPSATKDFFGLKNFGVNYGLVFTSWGVGGFMLALLARYVNIRYQTFNFAYYFSATLLIISAIASFRLKAPHHSVATESAEG